MRQLVYLVSWLALAGAAVGAAPATPTFCNPLNLDYGWNLKGYRHSADPVIVLFKDRYYLFATDDVPGYRVSDDLLTWTNVRFGLDSWPLVSDNAQGTYCAPAVTAHGDYVYFIRMSRRKTDTTVPVMRSADPAVGRWEQCGTLRPTSDPALFFGPDGRAWLYHGLSQPTKVFEIDTNTWTEVPHSERQLRAAVTNLADCYGGYERGRRELLDEVDTSAWLNRFQMLPCQEAVWMTERAGRYYLQYSTPGTVSHWYCDTVLEGDSPTGPFRQVAYAPVSLKVGGFIGSAGHSCVFQDRYGNWWRVTTMWIGVHHLFERRLGLFPVGFDEAGRMFTQTALGDYPQVLPQGRRDPATSPLAGWWPQSFQKTCTASSSLPGHPPALAADENVRSWWSAKTGHAGEWFEMDLGRAEAVTAVQVNFAEQDCVAKTVKAGESNPRYRLLVSRDGTSWRSARVEPAAGSPPTDARMASGPHDYLVLAEPEALRFLRVENVFTPAGGRFALSDLRVFGSGHGSLPPAVPAPRVTRHRDDDRNATLSWQPSSGADGYLVRFGIVPDHLTQVLQLQGGANSTLTTHILNRGIAYYWQVDAFNADGWTPGQVTAPAK